LLVSLLLLCAGTQLLFAGPSDVLSDSTYSPDDRARLLAVFEEAERDELPTDALLERLVEGLSKNVSADRMEQALRTDIGYLLRARELLAASDSEDILEMAPAWERAANLLRSGWTDDTLVALATACRTRPESFREASILVISLEDWGVDQLTALTLTRAAVDRLDPHDFPEVAALLATAQRRRIPLSQAATIIEEGLAEGRSIRQLRTLINRTNEVRT